MSDTKDSTPVASDISEDDKKNRKVNMEDRTLTSPKKRKTYQNRKSNIDPQNCSTNSVDSVSPQTDTSICSNSSVNLNTSRYGRTRKPKITEDFYNIEDIFGPYERITSSPARNMKKKSTKLELSPNKNKDFVNLNSDINSVLSVNIPEDNVEVTKVLKIVSSSKSPEFAPISPSFASKPVKTYGNKNKRTSESIVESFGLPDYPVPKNVEDVNEIESKIQDEFKNCMVKSDSEFVSPKKSVTHVESKVKCSENDRDFKNLRFFSDESFNSCDSTPDKSLEFPSSSKKSAGKSRILRNTKKSDTKGNIANVIDLDEMSIDSKMSNNEGNLEKNTIKLEIEEEGSNSELFSNQNPNRKLQITFDVKNKNKTIIDKKTKEMKTKVVLIRKSEIIQSNKNLKKPINGYESCDSVEINIKNEYEDSFVKGEDKTDAGMYSPDVGALAWSRVGNYPFWPSLVTSEPGTDRHYKMTTVGRKQLKCYHVHFFGDNGRRSWVLATHIFPFQKRSDLEIMARTVSKKSKPKDPKHLSAYIVNANKLNKWETAVTESESLTVFPPENRIKKFFEMVDSKKTEKNDKKRKLSIKSPKMDMIQKRAKLDHKLSMRKKYRKKILIKPSKKLSPKSSSASTNSELIGLKIEHDSDDDDYNLDEISNDMEEKISDRILKKRARTIDKIRKSDATTNSDTNSESTKKKSSSSTESKFLSTVSDESFSDSEMKTSEPDIKTEIQDRDTLSPVPVLSQAARYKRINLFRGITRDRVCQICGKLKNVVKCKGSCFGLFHIECDNKVKQKLNSLHKIKDNAILALAEDSDSTRDSLDSIMNKNRRSSSSTTESKDLQSSEEKSDKDEDMKRIIKGSDINCNKPPDKLYEHETKIFSINSDMKKNEIVKIKSKDNFENEEISDSKIFEIEEKVGNNEEKVDNKSSIHVRSTEFVETPDAKGDDNNKLVSSIIEDIFSAVFSKVGEQPNKSLISMKTEKLPSIIEIESEEFKMKSIDNIQQTENSYITKSIAPENKSLNNEASNFVSSKSLGKKNERTLSLAEQIDLKMQEVMLGLVEQTKYSDSTTDESSEAEDTSELSYSSLTLDNVVKPLEIDSLEEYSHLPTDNTENSHLSSAVSQNSDHSQLQSVSSQSLYPEIYTSNVKKSSKSSVSSHSQSTTSQSVSPEIDSSNSKKGSKIIKRIVKHVTADGIFDIIEEEEVDTTDYSTFKCTYCTLHVLPPCFICGKDVARLGDSKKHKCMTPQCGKYYHSECLKEWPQAKWQMSTKSNHIDNENLCCPYHNCHTCISDDPRGPNSRHTKEKLAKCIRCPTTYHINSYCIPAGTEILSTYQIMCPKHILHSDLSKKAKAKHMPHVNASWCFICSMGGSLICCETCPSSFHVECLKLSPPEGRYLCEECESGRLPLYNEIVWVKLGAYRWWPAQILFPNEIPENVKNIPHNKGEFVVRFFGSHDHYWVNRGRVFLFQEGDTGHSSSKKSSVDGLFLKAIEEATKAHKKFQDERANRAAEARTGMKPPPFTKIKVNRPVGDVRTADADTSNTTPCDCDPNGPNPCGPDSDCLNRILLTECNRLVCAAGSKCCNQAFEKRQYPPVLPFKTAGRGWGLKCLATISKGSFVIEYVGEVINETEYRRRMTRKHEQKDENYYFLTIDKDRMIDAGPKGNVARFMNHSCSPNCETQKWTVNGDTRVGLFAIVDIPQGTELTFNYNLECIGEEKKECHCEAPNCSGYIGVKVKPEDNGKKRKSSLKPKKKKSSIVPEIKFESATCFVCGESDAIQQCDREACNKCYHLHCIQLDHPAESKWVCPWHSCNVCTKRTTRCCYTCINSYCPLHSEGNIRYDRVKGFICTQHDIKERDSSTSNEKSLYLKNNDKPVENDAQPADNVEFAKPTTNAISLRRSSKSTKSDTVEVNKNNEENYAESNEENIRDSSAASKNKLKKTNVGARRSSRFTSDIIEKPEEKNSDETKDNSLEKTKEITKTDLNKSSESTRMDQMEELNGEDLDDISLDKRMEVATDEAISKAAFAEVLHKIDVDVEDMPLEKRRQFANVEIFSKSVKQVLSEVNYSCIADIEFKKNQESLSTSQKDTLKTDLSDDDISLAHLKDAGNLPLKKILKKRTASQRSSNNSETELTVGSERQMSSSHNAERQNNDVSLLFSKDSEEKCDVKVEQIENKDEEHIFSREEDKSVEIKKRLLDSSHSDSDSDFKPIIRTGKKRKLRLSLKQSANNEELKIKSRSANDRGSLSEDEDDKPLVSFKKIKLEINNFLNKIKDSVNKQRSHDDLKKKDWEESKCTNEKSENKTKSRRSTRSSSHFDLNIKKSLNVSNLKKRTLSSAEISSSDERAHVSSESDFEDKNECFSIKNINVKKLNASKWEKSSSREDFYNKELKSNHKTDVWGNKIELKMKKTKLNSLTTKESELLEKDISINKIELKSKKYKFKSSHIEENDDINKELGNKIEVKSKKSKTILCRIEDSEIVDLQAEIKNSKKEERLSKDSKKEDKKSLNKNKKQTKHDVKSPTGIRNSLRSQQVVDVTESKLHISECNNKLNVPIFSDEEPVESVKNRNTDSEEMCDSQEEINDTSVSSKVLKTAVKKKFNLSLRKSDPKLSKNEINSTNGDPNTVKNEYVSPTDKNHLKKKLKTQKLGIRKSLRSTKLHNSDIIPEENKDMVHDTDDSSFHLDQPVHNSTLMDDSSEEMLHSSIEHLTDTESKFLKKDNSDGESPEKNFKSKMKHHKPGSRKSLRYHKLEENLDISEERDGDEINKNQAENLMNAKLHEDNLDGFIQDEDEGNSESDEEAQNKEHDKSSIEALQIKRKRGRPRKYPVGYNPNQIGIKRPRGRPRKQLLTESPKQNVETITELYKMKLNTETLPKNPYENHVNEVKLTSNVPARHLRVMLRKHSEIDSKIDNKFLKMQNDIERDLPIRKRSKLRYEAQL